MVIATILFCQCGLKYTNGLWISILI